MPASPPVTFAPSLLDALRDGSAPCQHCGEPYFIDLLEIWPGDRAFQFETCCEVAHALLVEESREWPRRVWAAFFEQFAGLTVRHVHTGHIPAAGEDRGAPACGLRGGQWTLDYGLRVEPIRFQDAATFVRTHHRHNAAPAGWRWGHACYNGPELVAVAMVGRPRARKLDHTTIVEVNRLCVNPSLEPGLVWNACSLLYGAAAREAERRGFTRILTYTIEGEESGTSVKAAGWTDDGLSAGGSWDRPSRRRVDTADTRPKRRWTRALRPSARARAERATVEAARAARNAARNAARRPGHDAPYADVAAAREVQAAPRAEELVASDLPLFAAVGLVTAARAPRPRHAGRPAPIARSPRTPQAPRAQQLALLADLHAARPQTSAA